MKPIIVGVAGGSGSGKTSVCEYLLNISYLYLLALNC